MTVALADSQNPRLANSQAIAVKVDGDNHAVLDMPQDLTTGPLNLVVNQDETSQMISLIFDASKSDIPIYTGDAADVCSGRQFFDANGVLRVGTKDCNAGATTLSACAEDGETDCIATAAFPAAQIDGSHLDEKNVKNGVTIAGISGTLLAYSPCSGDGQEDCVTTARYKSMDTDVSVISATDIRMGKTAGGIAGGLTVGTVIAANDGLTRQVQRSFIRFVDITFSDPSVAAIVAADASLVSINWYGIDGTLVGDYTQPLTLTDRGGGTLRFDFGVNGIGDGTSGSKGSIAANGIYQINFSLASNGFADTSIRFYRLLGDTNDDGRVDATDVNGVMACITDGTYDYDHDTDFNNLINASDRFYTLIDNGKAVTGGYDF